MESESLLSRDEDAHQRPHATRVALFMALAVAVLCAAFRTVPPPDSVESGERMSAILGGPPKATIVNGSEIDLHLPSNTTMHLFKRTVASLSPSEDAAFVFRYAGLTVNETDIYTCNAGTGNNSAGEFKHRTATGRGAKVCAERAIVVSVDQFQIHFFHSHLTADTTEGASMRAWIEWWNALHHGGSPNASSFGTVAGGASEGEGYENEGGAGNASSRWDHAHFSNTTLSFNEFTPQSITFFTPDLSDFVSLWTKDGVPTMRRQYSSNASHTGFVYSGRIATPASGFIIEIIAYDLDPKFRASFASYADDECAPAMEVHFSNLDSVWKLAASQEYRDLHLPRVLVAQLTQPVQASNGNDDDDLLSLGLYLEKATGHRLARVVTQHPEHNCASATVWVKVNNGGSYYIPIRTVANGAVASNGASLSVAAFQNEMTAMLDGLMGCNQGYSRFIDWHIGISIDPWISGRGTSLDLNAEFLCEAGIGFHNGGTLKNDSGIGSNWARGYAGVGVEFMGQYDGSVFHNASQFDYCSVNGFSSEGVSQSRRLSGGKRSATTANDEYYCYSTATESTDPPNHETQGP